MHDDYALIEAPMMTSTLAETVRLASQYWTPERIRQALPIPLPHLSPSRQDRLPQPGAEESSQGAALIARPVLPRNVEWKPPTLSAANTHRTQTLSAYPFSVVGKLRMAFAGGNFVGSAWVIGRRAIMTAGHCLFAARSGGWAANVQFLPQALNGSTIGTWTVSKMTALREFVQQDDLRFDLAVGILDRDIADHTGIAGYLVNYDVQALKQVVGIGYPARPQDGFPFNGEEMWQSTGRIASDQAPGSTRDRNFGAYNDLSSGCSGGPWFTTESPGLAVGLNSHILSDSAGNPVDIPRQMRSPYFGGAFLRLVKWLKDNGGQPNEPGQPPESEEPGDDKPTVKQELLSIAESLARLANRL